MGVHHRLVSILSQIRQDLAKLLSEDAIHAACRAENYTWRDRLLNPVTTIHLFILQILHGNTALKHLPRLAGAQFTDSAFCTARKRLPLGILQRLLRRIAETLVPPRDRDRTGASCWFGHRVFFLDGSSFSMPDTAELQHHFGQDSQQQPGCGFPTAHLMALFHAGTGGLTQIFAAPLHTSDIAQAPLVHPALQPGDVAVGDRGFCSYAHLALLALRGVFGLFRVHQKKQIIDFTPGRPHALPGDRRGIAKGKPKSRWLKRLGVLDQLVEWFKPTDPPAWLSAVEYARLPESLVVRELRYRVTCPGFRTREVTLVTTLLDAEWYPAEALAALYRQRWQVEEYFKEMKQTLKMDILKCKTVDGVLKEMTIIALVYNLVRGVLVDAARRQGVALERLSFIDALRWLETARVGGRLPTIVVNPDRRNRVEPRVRKRRPKEYPLMKRPRRVLRAELLAGSVAA
jgi:Transposase DDE domain